MFVYDYSTNNHKKVPFKKRLFFLFFRLTVSLNVPPLSFRSDFKLKKSWKSHDAENILTVT